MSKDNEKAQPPARSETLDLMETLAILDPAKLHVERDAGEGLKVSYADRGEFEGGTVEPCYPITDFGRYLLLLDSEGEEIGLIADIEELDDDSMQAVEAELKEQHFIPIITRVLSISREFHVPVWEVETDRGPRRLELKRRRDVHRMKGGRIYVRDASGDGYLIPNVRELDPASRETVLTNI
ncbi:MAG: DUF1854 domain-containing protein [Candidatus Brocadiia bacterium]